MDPKTALLEHCYELTRIMNAQDNRSTSFPLFVIRERRLVPTHEDFADFHQAFGEEGAELEEKDLCEECTVKFECNDDLDSACVACGYLKTLPVKKIWEFRLDYGVYLTEEECDRIIEGRKYNFGKDANSYAISASASYEVSHLLFLISQIGLAPDKNSYPF